MTPLEVIDKIARGDVYVDHRHVSRRADDRRDGEDLRGARLRPGAGVRRGRAGRRRRFATLDPAARDLEGYLFPETYALPRDTPTRAKLVRQMVGALRARVHAGAAAGGRRAAA